MRPGFQRVLAGRVCAALRLVLPKRLRGWGDALTAEAAGIAHDGEALRFALGGVAGLLPRALLAHFHNLSAVLSGGRPTGAGTAMHRSFDRFRQPRLAGVLCAVAAVLIGLAYMAAAGAPMVYLTVNAGALGIGCSVLAAAMRQVPNPEKGPGAGILALALALLATSLFGSAVEGATRWVVVGPLFVQTSLLFLPLMIVAFARNRTVPGAAGMGVAALALALQPDRAMAGVLLAGLAVLALLRFDRWAGIALAGAASAFVATVTRPDTLPAVPYVDRILYTAFDVHPLAGAALWVGAALLLLPAIIAWRGGVAEREPAAAFGAVWLAVILAAALGNYPTPVVGYGGSAVIGYLMSLSALPRLARPAKQAEAGSDEREYADTPGLMRSGALLPA